MGTDWPDNAVSRAQPLACCTYGDRHQVALRRCGRAVVTSRQEPVGQDPDASWPRAARRCFALDCLPGEAEHLPERRGQPRYAPLPFDIIAGALFGIPLEPAFAFGGIRNQTRT